MIPYTLLLCCPDGGQSPIRLQELTLQEDQWSLSPEQLAAWCHCPAEALQIDRVGPVHLAHGGQWAKVRELPVLQWPLLHPHGLPLVINGPAIAVRPDQPGHGGSGHGDWRALSHWEARNAFLELLNRGQDLPLSEAMDLRFRRQMYGPELDAYTQAQWRGDEATALQLRLQVLERERRWQIAAQQREAQRAAAAS